MAISRKNLLNNFTFLSKEGTMYFKNSRKAFFLGVDYYPEEWPPDIWDQDVNLMYEAKFNIVRLADYAWPMLEPSPGRFTFDWLDEAIEKLNAKGIKVILATPRYPPIWFPKMYPDALPVDDQGRRIRFGRNGAWMSYCPHNPNFLRCIERIVRALAEHYKDNPNVYGWQIDNETQWSDPYPNMVCYCEYTKEKFREWLKAKYGSIEKLNEKIGTKFFPIQIYSDWGEIDPPWPPLREKNRGLALDWLRFRSDSLIELIRFEASIIRNIAPHQKITTNRISHQIDNYKLSKFLDFISYDSYPKYRREPDPAVASMYYDWFRSMKNTSFWVMELQSGIFFLGKMPRPGEIRKWTYQAIGRGADGILYFRWRTTPYGVEQFVYGIPGPDNRLDRRYYEIKKVGEEIRKLEEHICETACKSDVAILCSYDNIWSTDIEKDDYGRNFLEDMFSVYKGLWLNHIPVDIVEPLCDLTKYKIVFTPFFYIMNEEIALNLKEYVKNGGILISDARLAVKNEYNGIFSEPLPGLLTDLFGITIDDHDIVEVGDNRRILGLEGAPIFAQKEASPVAWVEALGLSDADALAIHKGTWLDGAPAITMHKYGGGRAIYIGTFFSTELVNLMVRDFINGGLIKPIANLDDSEVEVARRDGRDFSLLFIINHSDKYKKVKLRLEKTYSIEDLFDGRSFESNALTVDLKPDDVKVLMVK